MRPGQSRRAVRRQKVRRRQGHRRAGHEVSRGAHGTQVRALSSPERARRSGYQRAAERWLQPDHHTRRQPKRLQHQGSEGAVSCKREYPQHRRHSLLPSRQSCGESFIEVQLCLRDRIRRNGRGRGERFRTRPPEIRRRLRKRQEPQQRLMHQDISGRPGRPRVQSVCGSVHRAASKARRHLRQP